MRTHGVCAADPAPVVGSTWNVGSILFSTPKLQCRWCCFKLTMGFWDIWDVLLIGMKQFTASFVSAARRSEDERRWRQRHMFSVRAAWFDLEICVELCVRWSRSTLRRWSRSHPRIGPAFQICLWGMSHDVSCKQLKHKGDIVATRLWCSWGSMATGAVLQCGMNFGSLCDTPRQVLLWQFGDVSQTTCECGRFEFCRWSYDILRSGEGHQFDQR